jgi:hypothetical protein
MNLGSRARRLAKRFCAIYLATYMGLMLAALIPGLAAVRQHLVLMVARALFGAAVPDGSTPSGSGDRAVAWAAVVLTLLLAVLFAALFSALPTVLPLRAPSRRTEARGHAMVRMLTRLYLFWSMLGYGAVKVLKSQFPEPNALWLDEALGDMSPMRLLWAFMGHSTSYTVFTGLAELLAGVMVLFHRTRLLGALLLTAIMANLLMLNLSYDVPVKLGSAHLLVMAAFVAWPDRGRLRALLVPPDAIPWPAGRARTALMALVTVLAILATAFVGVGAYRNYVTWGDGRPKRPHEGRYAVTRYAVNGVEVPSGSAPERWQRVLITRRHVAVVRGDGELHTHLADVRDDAIELSPRMLYGEPERGEENRMLQVRALMDGRLELTAESEQGTLVVALEPKPARLRDRGFHWVTEFPYNR